MNVIWLSFGVTAATDHLAEGLIVGNIVGLALFLWKTSAARQPVP